MTAARLKTAAAITLISALVLCLCYFLRVLPTKHESDLIKKEQIAEYVIKADAGDYGAASELYIFYKTSNQTEYALHWLRIAAEGGEESPNEWLLDTLEKSANSKDRDEAFKLLKKLADKGEPPFQTRLGEKLLNGPHNEIDSNQANSYLSSAAKKGYKPAILKYSDRLANNADSVETIIEAIAWRMAADICLSNDSRMNAKAANKGTFSINGADLSKSQKDAAIAKSILIHSLISEYTKAHETLDFRYCGIER